MGGACSRGVCSAEDEADVLLQPVGVHPPGQGGGLGQVPFLKGSYPGLGTSNSTLVEVEEKWDWPLPAGPEEASGSNLPTGSLSHPSWPCLRLVLSSS